MPNRFYRRRWEGTRGDEFDGWGHSLWYFEVDDDGWPIRQIETYEAGPVLRYGPGHDHDRYGGLGDQSLFDSGEDWSGFEIMGVEFERAWQSDNTALGPESPAQDERLLRILRERDGTETLVVLRDGRRLTVRDIAWGYDVGEGWAHVTTNISPGFEGAVVDFFSTEEIVQVVDPANNEAIYARE